MRAVCGLDVHKDTVYLCILCDTGEIFEKVYGVLTHDLREMRRDMRLRGVTEATMESTATYWIPVWRVLEPSFRLKLVNPYFIRQLPGRKSDVKDAQWIAECTLKDLVRGSFVPPERIQQLRQYDRRIYDLDAEIVRKLSKLDGIMQRCNIRLSNYVSNTDTKSYKDVVDDLCNGITDPEELIRKVHGRIVNKHGRETILASLTGVVSDAEKDTMRQLRAEITLAEEHKQECLDKMVAICKTHYPEELKRLMTIPGIKERAATSLIAEIGTDMSKFPTAAHLASWSGLKPRNDVSNGKYKSRRITHGNVYLRKTIIECAWAASRTKDCFFSRFSYHQTVVRKKHRLKVLVAVARKLLIAVWHVLHDEKDYADFDPDRKEPATNG